jgi:hypothetical protein
MTAENDPVAPRMANHCPWSNASHGHPEKSRAEIDRLRDLAALATDPHVMA